MQEEIVKGLSTGETVLSSLLGFITVMFGLWLRFGPTKPAPEKSDKTLTAMEDIAKMFNDTLKTMITLKEDQKASLNHVHTRFDVFEEKYNSNNIDIREKYVSETHCNSKMDVISK